MIVGTDVGRLSDAAAAFVSTPLKEGASCYCLPASGCNFVSDVHRPKLFKYVVVWAVVHRWTWMDGHLAVS
jgi:hypothetical protein